MGQAYEPSGGARITLIALGCNVTSIWGDPIDTLKMAMIRLSEAFSVTLQKSRLYQTPAFPAGAGPDYVNAAAAFETGADARAVLAILHTIEADAGRTREIRWGQRTLDLDLIGQGAQVLPDRAGYDHWRNLPVDQQIKTAPDRLILPHPRLQDRAFVLVPLADIAPDWIHPVSGQSVRQMAAALPQTELDSVKPLN